MKALAASWRWREVAMRQQFLRQIIAVLFAFIGSEKASAQFTLGHYVDLAASLDVSKIPRPGSESEIERSDSDLLRVHGRLVRRI